MTRSEITHDPWGNTKIEHYGSDGDYVGSSRPATDAWGNEVSDQEILIFLPGLSTLTLSCTTTES